MRVVRTVIGVLVLLVALPLLLAGGVLWTAMSHRDPDGSFAATLDPVRTDGYAVVVADIDALLRRDAAFARGGQTTVRLTARAAAGPAFIGLAPAGAVAEYLDGVAHAQVTEVKVTRGRLPVRATAVPGTQAPARSPVDQTFWVAASTTPTTAPTAAPTAATTVPTNATSAATTAVPTVAEASSTIEWAPAALRNQHLALVVMNPDGRPPVAVSLRASVTAGWLPSTTGGVLVLGTVLLASSLAVLCWPSRPREVVYVVPAAGPIVPHSRPATPALPAPPTLAHTPLALPAAPSPAAPSRWKIPPPAVPTLDWPPRSAAKPRPAEPRPAEPGGPGERPADP